MSQIVPVRQVIRFEELHRKNVLEIFPQAHVLDSYLPDLKDANKVDKRFFLTLVNTISPGFIDELTVELIQKRQRSQGTF